MKSAVTVVCMWLRGFVLTDVSTGCITTVRESQMMRLKFGVKWDPKQDSAAQSCTQITKQFIECMGPLQVQVNSNTRRIVELEKKLEAQQKDAETLVNRAHYPGR